MFYYSLASSILTIYIDLESVLEASSLYIKACITSLYKDARFNTLHEHNMLIYILGSISVYIISLHILLYIPSTILILLYMKLLVLRATLALEKLVSQARLDWE